MKKLTLTLALFIFTATTVELWAQLSRSERKELKKEAKNLKKNPEELKELMDEVNSLKGQNRSLNNQLTDLQSKMGDKDARISSLQKELNDAKASEAAALKAANDAKKAAADKPAKNEALDDSGVWFRVQVGAFKNIDMSEYFKNNPNFSGEETEDGLQRITLGRFRDYWEADKFKKALRDMGVRQAWIVPYKDGARKPMRDVLEGVIDADKVQED